MSVRKLFTFGVVGAVLGGVIALVAPPLGLSASEGCECFETGSSKYKCQGADACIPGTFKCEIDCSS